MANPIDRKEFLERLFRRGAILGMGGVGLAAMHGSKTPEECFAKTTLCKECWVHHNCTLPEKGLDPDERAKKTRQA